VPLLVSASAFQESQLLGSSACKAPWFQLWTRDWNGNGIEKEDYTLLTHTMPPGWPTSWVQRKRERKKERVGAALEEIERGVRISWERRYLLYG
jgi:hypothetical protein